MRFWLNIIWLVFGGFVLFLDYIFFGLLACIFIVTIPAGIASFRIASYIIWPFGKRVVPMPGAGAGSFFIAGIWLAIGHVITAFFQAITIIGIPLAIANLKLIPITCFPFGKMVIDDPQATFV